MRPVQLTLRYYRSLPEQVKETKRKLLDFLIQPRREGKVVASFTGLASGVIQLGLEDSARRDAENMVFTATQTSWAS